MILLDTDHLSVYGFPQSPRYITLESRVRATGDEFGTTIVCVEEQLRGWLAEINRTRDVHDQIPAYEHLRKLFDFYRGWHIAAFDERAADSFKSFRKAKVRIGSQDLKIASIALSRDALLLSANLSDFRQVPGLRVESWLEP
jgi:tRNA(fMet)-specific endonuclease VapC